MAAVYLSTNKSLLPCHRRLLEEFGESPHHADTLNDLLTLIDTTFVPLVLLSDEGGYSVFDLIFPIKSRNSLTQVAVLSANRPPNRLPAHLDAWICVSEHEKAIRHRIRGMLATAWNELSPQAVSEYLA